MILGLQLLTTYVRESMCVFLHVRVGVRAQKA